MKEVKEIYESAPMVDGKDWQGGVCFYHLCKYALKIFSNYELELTKVLVVNKHHGKPKDHFIWNGQLQKYHGLRNPVELVSTDLDVKHVKIGFEHVPNHDNLLFLELYIHDRKTGYVHDLDVVLHRKVIKSA